MYIHICIMYICIYIYRDTGIYVSRLKCTLHSWSPKSGLSGAGGPPAEAVGLIPGRETAAAGLPKKVPREPNLGLNLRNIP